MLSPRALRATGERGQVVVLFALLIPVLFAIGAIVIDVGNWYVHKRHLQTQVDAAALASGPQFVGCFLNPTGANAAIASRALAYAGDTLRLGKIGPNAPDSTTNLQLAEPNDVRVVLNSSRYWASSDGQVPGANGYGLDNSVSVPGDPCSTRFLDAKATDEAVRPLWGLFPLTPSPKTHAKIEIFDAESVSGMLPWAVPEIEPRAVYALFIDEDPGANPVVFDQQELMPADDPTLPWSEWVTQPLETPITLDGGHENTGVMILVSKDDPSPTVTGPLSGPSGICNQAPGLVACYGTGASQTSGLSFIHGYNGGVGSNKLANPIVRQVELGSVGCTIPADYSAPYFTLDGNCTSSVRAVVDFGVGAANPGLFPNCVTVTSSPGGTLTWTGDVAEGSVFEGGSFNLATGSGRNTVNLSWRSLRRPGRNNCNQTVNSGNFNKVAAPYVANNASGPVQYLNLEATKTNLTPMPDANSVELNDPGNTYYNYTVTVGLPKPHDVDANFMDDPLLLRMASPSGSQNQAWDCDSGRNFREEIATGCKTKYIENFRDLDGDGDLEWNNILCAGWNTGNLPPPTIRGPSPYPSDCVMTETGDKTGQLRDGLHDRLETPCYENNWPDDLTELEEFLGPDGTGPGKDPRYVTLIITDNTAFTGSGNEPLPIKYFAGFYVTGWDYHSVQSPGCPDIDGPGSYKGNDDHPIYGPVGSYPQSRDNGDVWGYFVDIVLFTDQGYPSKDPCMFGGAPAACIAVLVE